MAAVKRAIRRLVRGPDGTVRVKYIDLDTFAEVLDLTGYEILSTGQTTPEPEQSDNPDDEEVEINPPSGGSSGGQDTSRGERGSNDYISGKTFTKPTQPATTPTTTAPKPAAPQYGEDDGNVTVTPDKDIADAEWAGVESDNVSEDKSGNVTVSDPNNPSRTSVFGPLDQTKFDQNVQEWSQTQRDLKMADFNEVENTKKANIAAMPPGVGVYTKAQQNIDTGVTMDFSGVRPEAKPTGLPAARTGTTVAGRPETLAPTGLPAARTSTARSVINGVRPEAPASGLPAARQGTTVAGRPAGPATGLPGAQGIAGTPSRTTNAVRPEGPVSGLPAASKVSVPSRDVVSGVIGGVSKAMGVTNPADTISAQRAVEPSAERFGRESVADQAARAKSQVNPVSGMEMASDIGTTSNPAGARPEGPAAGMPAARTGTTVATRPEGPASGMPAANKTGTPSVMSAPPSRPDAIGKNAGLSGLYGEKTAAKESTAKSVISDATNTARATSARPTVGKPTTTTYENAGGYSVTEKTGTAGWRNNNPGNLEASGWTKSQPGYIGAAGGVAAPGWAAAPDGTMARMAVFDSVENGIKAQAALLGTPAYNSLTISDAIARYAPAFENNPTAYAKAVADAIGVDVNSKMSDLTPAERAAMASAMHEVEGSTRPGTTKTSLTGKGIAARDHYTGPNTGSDTPSERNAASRPSSGGVSFGSSGYRGSGSDAIGRNDSAGAGRGSSSGGPGLSRSSGGSSGSSGGGNYGGGNSGPGGSAGKSASGGVSGASRSTAGKTGSSPSSKSGGTSGASRSTSGKTGGTAARSGSGGSEGASARSGGMF